MGCAVGMVNGAGMSGGGAEGVRLESMAMGRPTIYACLALFVMAVVGYVDVRKLASVRWWLNPLLWSLVLAVG